MVRPGAISQRSLLATVGFWVLGTVLVTSLAVRTGFPTGNLSEDLILWGLSYAVISVSLWPRRPLPWVVAHLAAVAGLWTWSWWSFWTPVNDLLALAPG